MLARIVHNEAGESRLELTPETKEDHKFLKPVVGEHGDFDSFDLQSLFIMGDENDDVVRITFVRD